MSATRGRTRPEVRAGSTGETRRARIAFVGVDPDARGGIAQFGANLVRGVEAEVDTFILSYRRLYPGFTRPGRQGPDPTPGGSGLSGLQVIVPWQPSTWRAAAEALERFGPDLVVLQWWSPLFAGCVRFLARRARRRGARVVIVCHNDRAHEGFPLGHSLTRAALSEGDVLLTLSAPVAERLRQLVPGAVVHTLHHPPNMAASDTGATTSTLRGKLGSPDGPVVLFFGNVRKYKGLADLIDAMPLVRRKTGATLVVAGTFFEPVERFRAQATALGLRLGRDIRLLPGYVPRDQVPALFELADVVALPYRSASQSGVISQAALAGTPVVVTAVGGLPEAVGRRGVVVPPQDPAALAAGIVRALESPPPPPSLPDGGWDDWRDILLGEVQPTATGARRHSSRPGPNGRAAVPATEAPPADPAPVASPRSTGGSNGHAPTNGVHPTNGVSSAVARGSSTEELGKALWEVARVYLDQAELRAPTHSNGVATVEAPPVEPPEAPRAAPVPEPDPEPDVPSSSEPEILGSRHWPRVVLALALAASVCAAVYTHVTGRVGLFGDAASHLLHGRRVFDSVSPGFGQLGNYWPPLQHFLELPFVWIDPLYHSMWAGSLPAMAFYVIGVMGAYRLGVELTRDRRAGALAALAFGANPSLLYLQATPMLESAIAMSLVWVVASLLRFRRTGRFRDVVVAGLWSSVAVWSTWGAMVLPLYGAVVVAAACRRHGYGWRQTETFALAYALAAGYTLLLWMTWNFYIQHDPLYMFHYHQPVGQLITDESFVSGHKGDPVFALLNYGAAVVDLLGPVICALMVIVLAGAVVRRRLFHPGGIALIGGGLIFGYMTFRGTAVGSPLWADLKDLTGGEARNLNVRYALWMVPFVPVAVAALAGRSRLRQISVLVLVAVGMLWFMPSVHGVSTIDPAAQSAQANRFEGNLGGELQRALDERPGRLLMSSINGGDRLIWRSEVDTKRFLTEANADEFKEALAQPGRHARWVLLAPGSTVRARYSLEDLEALGYTAVWSDDGRATPDSRYVLLRLGPA